MPLSPPPVSPPASPPASRCPSLPADLLRLVVLTGLATTAAGLGAPPGALALVGGMATVAAALLLGSAAAAGGSRRGYPIAVAVGPPALLGLLHPVGGAPDQVWLLLGNLAALGSAGLLAAAGHGTLVRAADRAAALAALGVLLGVMAAVAVAGLLLPAWLPAPGAVLVTGLLAGCATAAAAILLVCDGVAGRSVLLRTTGLAVGAGTLGHALLGVAPGSAFGHGLLLAGAVLLVVAGCRARRGSAARPAVIPLPCRPPGGPGVGVAVSGVLADLALFYRALGLDVRVEVLGDPWVGADRGGLARLLATLLANCVRHAPGARVRVRAAARGPRVRIEVIDDGPGLPPGSTARLLRRGVRGPGSTGAGLGLAICTELVERYRGGFTVLSTSAGCTAVVELPGAHRGAPVVPA